MNAILLFAMLLMGGMAFAQFNISKLLQEEDGHFSSVLHSGLTNDSFELQQGGGNESDVTPSGTSTDSDTFQKGDGGLSVTDQVGTANFSLVKQAYNYREWGSPNRSYINHPETANQSSVNQTSTIFSDFNYSFVSQLGDFHVASNQPWSDEKFSDVNQTGDDNHNKVSQSDFIQMAEVNRAGLINTRWVILRGNNYGSLLNQQGNNFNSIVIQST